MSAATTAVAQSALDRLDGIGFPTKRDEAWRYAPHRLLGELSFGPSGAAADTGASTLDLDERLPVLGGARIVLVNGVVDRSRSSFDAPAGATFVALADSAADQTARGDRLDDDVTDAYMALNLAYGTDGVVVRVGDGVALDVPIHIVDIAVPGVAPTMSCTGVIIELGVGSTATVVESRIGVGDQVGGSNLRTTITVADDATLDHIVIQDLPAEQVHLSAVEATQGARSTLRARSFNLGAAYGRLEYLVTLTGPEAHIDLSGLFFGVGEQTLDQQITVIHDAADCTSLQSYRGVLDDASTGVFNGGIDVRAGADGTDAAQSNDNLLLSDRAEVNTQPRLEILADEVACKHGATVGQLDDTALYYLRSRGISAEEARRLLINGFADQMVDDVGIDSVCSWLTRRLGHDHD